VANLQWANRCLAARNLKVPLVSAGAHRVYLRDDSISMMIQKPKVSLLQGLQDAIDLSVTHPTWQRTRPDDPEDEHTG
jgi:hypothetical protein